jgi:hypothetical protein
MRRIRSCSCRNRAIKLFLAGVLGRTNAELETNFVTY